LFDRYVVVDWSARNAPARGADSIWIADLEVDRQVQLSNPPARHLAGQQLVDLVERCRDQRLLIGVDASLGYPAGSATLFGLAGSPWRAMWQAVVDLSTDDERNRNNRFEVASELNRRAGSGQGPFWGCPPSKADADLATTKPQSLPIAEFRRTEQSLRAGGLRPASCWQLLGAGSVGSQTLTLLPVLEQLRARVPERIDIWPFTTGLTAPQIGRGGVVAEVWPTMFMTDTPDPAIGRMVRDAEQVATTAQALGDADVSGALRQWFTPDLDEPSGIADEEGWILGVSQPPHVR
jgi:precorrin-8X/cobalt-precorrin-8 methylmutase